MNQDVKKLWGEELNWIKNQDLREKVAKTWELALEKSVLSADDLFKIPFTLKAPTNVSFMDHKRAVVHMSKAVGEKYPDFFGEELPVDMDVLIAGAILADVGKLLEYEKDENGNIIQGDYGKYLRHPFSGVSLAEKCGVPAPVLHIIAAHAGEGDHVSRSVEAYIVHHVDFMTFLPFKNRLIPNKK